ncbi:MAG: hypothetical protein QOF51_1143 [Chloroflexota bacterium]|nr:hypothetical protein [Chloroflexota bacterium]
MASRSHPLRTATRRFERAALLVLIGLIGVCIVCSLVLGPVLLFIVLVLGMPALALAEILNRGAAQEATELAMSGSIVQQPMLWGRVVRVVGRCPSGATPQQGQRFSVTAGVVRPELCEHARHILLVEAARIEDSGEMADDLLRYHDADHEMDFELHAEPMALRAAA